MFHQNFQEAFARLNHSQRKAVETIEGPLLIVAGPGTGKTQTLALRLANILVKTHARPHNLLALTFTEAAAVELKRRLALIVGPDAYGIVTATFHSFCQRLAMIFPEKLVASQEQFVLDSLGQFKIIREALSAGDYRLLSSATAPDSHLSAIMGSIAILKKEGYSPRKFAEIVNQEKHELDNMEHINPKTQRPFGKFTQAEKRYTKNCELARVYEHYQKLLTERELVDFDDLILSVVERLQDPQDDFLLAYLQENFLYATADEYQDTNGAQNAILQVWASYDSSPNLCVVGDDDQSIYRFQGASLANITEFNKKYPTAKIITLTENYRSTQVLLDASRKLIECNKQRLTHEIPGLSKILTAAIPTESAVSPRILEFSSEEDETAFVVREIQQLLAAGTSADEIAILYRNRRHGDLFVDYLTRAGVPFFRADGQNALDNLRVKQLIALLSAVLKPGDSNFALEVLFADYVDLPKADIYRLARLADRDSSVFDFLADEKALAALDEEMKDSSKIKIKFDNFVVLHDFAQKFLDWQAKLHEVSLTEFIETLIAESGLAKKIITKKEYVAAEAIAAFVGFVRKFETTTESFAPTDLLTDLKMMRRQNIALPIPNRPQKAVQLMTAHRSKGLEFSHVFVVHATGNEWGDRKKAELIKLPSLIPTTIDDDRIEDERRLFYVAMTRAKTTLTLTVARTYNGSERVPARFLIEIDSPEIKKKDVILKAEDKISFIVPVELRPVLDSSSRKFLASLVDYFRLSPTALSTYLECPRRFLFQNLLRIPMNIDSSDREGAIFGLAVHEAFEGFFQELKKTGQSPKIEIALIALKKSLSREPLTVKQRKVFIRDAGQAVQNYLDFHALQVAPPLENEYSFGKHDVRLDDIPLTGKVDRIDLIPGTKNEVCVVDYKTSPVQSRNGILGHTANSTGSLYRQLIFYKLLGELDPRFIFQIRTVMVSFVKPNSSGKFCDEVFTPRAEEVDDLKKTIREVFTRIRELDFECAEDADCRRCSFRGICKK